MRGYIRILTITLALKILLCWRGFRITIFNILFNFLFFIFWFFIAFDITCSIIIIGLIIFATLFLTRRSTMIILIRYFMAPLFQRFVIFVANSNTNCTFFCITILLRFRSSFQKQTKPLLENNLLYVHTTILNCYTRCKIIGSRPVYMQDVYRDELSFQ